MLALEAGAVSSYSVCPNWSAPREVPSSWLPFVGRTDRLLTGDPVAKSASSVFPQTSKSDNLGEKMKAFMQKYDKNSDGKIEMAEVSPAVLARSSAGGAMSPGPLPGTSTHLGT